MIVLYSQPTCGQCKMVHRLLDQKKIPYTECQDVDKMISLGINHTPTLEVEGKFIVGREIFNFINNYRG